MPSVFPPGARLGLRYRIARVVAHGPIAALYEAHQLDNGEAVAFKWLHAPYDHHATLGRLVDRAREAQRLRDPGLVDVLDVAREDDSLFVVTRWERGEPYSHLLAEHLMPLSQRLAVLAAAFAALEAGHRAGLAHGGLHPDNLYLGSRSGSAIKLLDLALNQTCCAAMFGTPQRVAAGHHVFMAPEQLEPRYTPNVRSDVFAAGVLACHALSGRLPFNAPDVARLRVAHAQPVKAPLGRVLSACLAARPEQRPSELAELRGELERYAREVVPQLAVPSPRAPAPMSETQAQARGELIVTPKGEREPEAASQPISLHGERRPTRWRALVASGFVMAALATVALWPRARVPTRPPPLPASPPAQTPKITEPTILEPVTTKPDAAKPQPRKRKRARRQEGFRTAPLSRDDF